MAATSTPQHVPGPPVSGMAGWGCPDVGTTGGDYLSDGYPTAEDATWAAQQACSLMARRPYLTVDQAVVIVAQCYHARVDAGRSEDGERPLAGRTAEVAVGSTADEAKRLAQVPGGTAYDSRHPATPETYWLVVAEDDPLGQRVQRWVDRLGYRHLDCWADPELIEHLHAHALSALDADGIVEEQIGELAVARVADAMVVLYGGATTPPPTDTFQLLLLRARQALQALGLCWDQMYGPNEALTGTYEALDSMEREYGGS